MRPHPFYLFAGGLIWPFLRWLPWQIEVQGFEHVPREGGFVLASTHFSNFDIWPLGYSFFPHRQLNFMAKAELFNPFLKPMLVAGGAFPVRRGEADVEAFRTAVRLVRSGEIVLMFPYGTRERKGMRKRHSPQPHTGAARIALAARAPLVPVAVHGTDRLLKIERMRVAFAPPVEFADLQGRRSHEAAEIATDRLMEAIEGLRELIAPGRRRERVTV